MGFSGSYSHSSAVFQLQFRQKGGADPAFIRIFAGNRPLQFIKGDVELHGYLISSTDGNFLDELDDDHQQ